MKSSRGKEGEGNKKRGNATKPKRGSAAKPKFSSAPKPKREEAPASPDKPKSKRSSTPYAGKRKGTPLPKFSEEVRLNKYLANTGVCSRREADTLIATGVVSVNGEIITEMGYKVKPGDVVKYDGHSIKPDTKRYVLLNKPKDFVISNNDAWGRKSIMAILAKACKEQVFPIDKLRKEDVGLMLCTNDADLGKKLTHPTQKVLQLFHLQLNKPMSEEDLTMLKTDGIFLGSSRIKLEDISLVKGKSAHEIGISLRTSNTKIIDRIMSKLGYEIVAMDRLEYAGLTKKDLPRGHFRHLTEKEVSFLKMS